jgi:hypothetical protein
VRCAAAFGEVGTAQFQFTPLDNAVTSIAKAPKNGPGVPQARVPPHIGKAVLLRRLTEARARAVEEAVDDTKTTQCLSVAERARSHTLYTAHGAVG